MYGTSPEPACKQISHQTRQHEKAREFHQMLMECCIYEIKMFLVPVWNEVCIGVICLCVEVEMSKLLRDTELKIYKEFLNKL